MTTAVHERLASTWADVPCARSRFRLIWRLVILVARLFAGVSLSFASGPDPASAFDDLPFDQGLRRLLGDRG